MYIITLLTKRSVREPEKEKKFLKFFSIQNFTSGDMIEIIDGNKKSPAIILKTERASDLKEEIRSGNLEIKKLKFSKSGENKDGKIIENFQISEIKNFLKNPNKAKESENKNIKNFFPRKMAKEKTRKNATHFSSLKKEEKEEKEASSISNILEKNFEKIISREKKYHSPTQELIDNIRKYFGENSRYGYGSFSYYIGMFKQIPLRDVEQIFAETKQLKKPIFEKKKIFWYRVGKYIKEKNKKF